MADHDTDHANGRENGTGQDNVSVTLQGRTLQLRVRIVWLIPPLVLGLTALGVMRSDVNGLKSRADTAEAAQVAALREFVALKTDITELRTESRHNREDMLYLREQIDRLNRTVKDLR